MSSAAGARRWSAVAAILLAALGALATWYVTSERTLYKDDHVAYWALSADLARSLRSDPSKAAASVAGSVSERELNLLPAAPVAVAMQLTGTSRQAYVLVVVVLYAVPAFLLLGWLAGRIAGDDGAAAAPAATAALLPWLPALVQPILLGYLDVGGVGLMALAWIGYLTATSRRSRWAVPAAGAGFAVGLAALFRRWYGIGALGFFVAIAVDGALRAIAARRRGRRAVIAAAAPATVAIGSAAATLALLAWPRLVTIATTDYADRFAAFAVSSGWIQSLNGAVARIGLVPLGVLLGCAAIAVGRHPSRRPALLVATQGVVAWIVFHRIQHPSPQHWYLWLPGLVALSAAGLAEVWSRLARRAGWLAAMGVAAGGLAVTAAALAVPSGAVPGRVIGQVRFEPQRRGDLEEIRRLLRVLDERLRLRPGPVYVVAAAGPLTDTSLGFANLSLGADFLTPRFVTASAHIDRRDGFPVNLQEARYVLVPLPVQVPQPPVHHRVVTETAAQVVRGAGVGAAFRRAPETFTLDGGLTVGLWERIRPTTAADVAALSAALKAYYPDRPFVWRWDPS